MFGTISKYFISFGASLSIITLFILLSFGVNSVFNLIFSLLILIFSFLVAYNRSIVGSVLALIGLAAVFSLILFGLGATFLAVLYLAVYIGAVAVFFLFVVMMTDLSDEEALSRQSQQKPLFGLLLIGLFFSVVVALLIFGSFIFNKNSAGLLMLDDVLTWRLVNNNGAAFNTDFLNFDSNIEAVARLLFQEHVASFLILAVVILIALVGAILLTSSINMVDKYELAHFELDPLAAVWENDKLTSFGDGKPQNMEVQSARTVMASVNLTKAEFDNK
jgi:NADH-quinone oxidoreductase subunit J